MIYSALTDIFSLRQVHGNWIYWNVASRGERQARDCPFGPGGVTQQAGPVRRTSASQQSTPQKSFSPSANSSPVSTLPVLMLLRLQRRGDANSPEPDPSQSMKTRCRQPRWASGFSGLACHALTLIYSSALRNGIIPADLRTAFVTPVFKNGECYRPENTLQNDLDNLFVWEDRWKMSFYPKKSQVVRTSRSRKDS